MATLSHSGLLVLEQLKSGPVEAGDLVSKDGRTNLVDLGLCHYKNGKWGLTPQGSALAMRTVNQFSNQKS
jgi:hypothetical protein